MAGAESYPDEKPDFKLHSHNSHSSQGSGDAIIDIEDIATVVNTNSDDLGSFCSPSPSIQTEEINYTITRTLEDSTIGYSRLAAFESSEPSFSLYRGFGYLHSRVLLELQDEIRILERDLDDLDKMDHENKNDRRLKSRAVDIRDAKREGQQITRRTLIAEIRDKLVQYDEILVKARELNAFQKPSNRDYKSVRTWFYNEKPLVEAEQEFIQRKEDIVTLRLGREWAGFDGLIESMLRKLDCKLIRKIFCTAELRAKTNNKCIYYYSTSRIEKFVGLIITIIIFILLVLPVVAMYRLTSIGPRNSTFDAIGVLVVFTLLFSAAMSLLTKARRHELFAASAAYCAVLVVFISNFNGNLLSNVQGGGSGG